MSIHIFLATMVPRQYREIIIYIAITLFFSASVLVILRQVPQVTLNLL